MTLVQLEYVVALDRFRHFALAAAHCYVTQPTLSMQIHKLEKEMGIKIFDRSKQPVMPTETGLAIIEHAKKILAERNAMNEMLNTRKGILSGELKIGIIPTLAPYLLPLFAQQFTKKYSHVKLVVNEMMTDSLVNRLREGTIDAGILVTPLQEYGIKEHVLFYEELLVYISRKNKDFKKHYVLAQDIDPHKLWLLEEGHCFRSQIMNLCELQKASKEGQSFEYEAGSIETLRRMVELSDGITILPELAVMEFGKSQLKLVKQLKRPSPAREVSLVTHRDHIKTKLIKTLQEEILSIVPAQMQKLHNKKVVEINY